MLAAAEINNSKNFNNIFTAFFISVSENKITLRLFYERVHGRANFVGICSQKHRKILFRNKHQKMFRSNGFSNAMLFKKSKITTTNYLNV